MHFGCKKKGGSFGNFVKNLVKFIAEMGVVINFSFFYFEVFHQCPVSFLNIIMMMKITVIKIRIKIMWLY